jgi:hypothetical protein
MVSRSINSSAVPVTRTATRETRGNEVLGYATEIESNSTTKGKDLGMTLHAKGKRSETSEVRAGANQSDSEITSADQAPSHEEIRLRAYEIYLERGGFPGNELDDWLQAERALERAPLPKRETQ